MSTITLLSTEAVVKVIIASKFSHKGDHALSTWFHPRNADPTPLLEDALVRLTNQANLSPFLLKSELIAGPDTQRFANFHRDCDLSFAGNFSANERGRRRFGRSGQCSRSLLLALNPLLRPFGLKPAWNREWTSIHDYRNTGGRSIFAVPRCRFGWIPMVKSRRVVPLCSLSTGSQDFG